MSEREKRAPFMRDGKLEDPVVVGESGSRLLLAERADIEAGNLRGPAQWHDARDGRWSPIIRNLQVWYKWGVWDAPSKASGRERYAELSRYGA